MLTDYISITNMLKKITSKIVSNPWIVLYHVLFIILLITNIHIGEYFIGWDALSPELNIPLNINRGIYGAWQEEYGLGVMTGHGFAATLPHTIIIFALTVLFPEWSVRFLFTIFCYWLGGLGLYFLAKDLLVRITKEKKHINILSFLASLFYLFNFGTIQIFYVQLEAFIVHFVALPWVVLFILKILHSQKKKHYVYLFIALLFASIQGFIPSVFVVFIGIVSLVLTSYMFNNSENTITKLKNIGGIILILFAANAYWILPMMYYSLSRSGVFLDSYNNILSTPQFIERSIKYGTIYDLPLIKGLYLDNIDADGYVLQPWINHQNNIIISTIGYLFFVISITGLFYLLKKRTSLSLGICSIFFVLFCFMAVDIFPFSIVSETLRAFSSFYSQAFRTVFTKFGIGFAFSLSVLFPFGILYLSKLLKSKNSLLYGSIGILLILYAFPVFMGNLFYDKLFVEIPKAYSDMQEYFDHQEDGRIALLPQDCSEGWYSYNWGYFGSGFLQYIIRQPLLARTYDVWSNYNENYQWQLSQAIREKNYQKVDAVLEKYDVSWILYDANVTHCRDQRTVLQYEDLITYIETSDDYYIEQVFSTDVLKDIALFKRTESRDEFVTAYSALQNITPQYAFSDNDYAYFDHGSYITSEQDRGIYYPYRSIFSKRGSSENGFTIEETDSSFLIYTPLELSDTRSFVVPSYTSLESTVPVEIAIDQYTGIVQAGYLFPTFYNNSTILVNGEEYRVIGTVPESPNPYIVEVNGQKINEVEANTYRSMISTKFENTVIIYDSNRTILLESQLQPTERDEITIDIPVTNYSNNQLVVKLPKVLDPNQGFGFFHNVDSADIVPVSCGITSESEEIEYEVSNSQEHSYIRLISSDSSQCYSYYKQTLTTSYDYLLSVNSRNVSGNSLRYYVSNSKGVRYLDVLLEPHDTFDTEYFVLPSSFPGSLGYTFTLENLSWSDTKTVNDYGSSSGYVIPLEYIRSIHTTDSEKVTVENETTIMSTKNTHNPTEYTLSNATGTIVLNQSYDNGWKAYHVKGAIQSALPFLFGQGINNHVLVNNWANGWVLDSDIDQDTTIKIVYLPQYLQYVGFGLLVIGMLGIVFYRKYSN